MTNHPNRNQSIRFAVVQSGYAVFGTGHTRQQAITDAQKWLEDENGQQGGLTRTQVENLLVARPNNGDFYILASDDDEFDSYLNNQGGYEHRNGKWFDAA